MNKIKFKSKITSEDEEINISLYKRNKNLQKKCNYNQTIPNYD